MSLTAHKMVKLKTGLIALVMWFLGNHIGYLMYIHTNNTLYSIFTTAFLALSFILAYFAGINDAKEEEK